MCGIAGIIMKAGNAPRDILEKMASSLSHRGPDGYGVWVDGAFGFVHTRLAIIDLATGDQPLISPSNSVLIGNGEIYNYVELLDGIAARAKSFSTQSDFAPVLDILERDGDDGLKHLRGMYALGFLTRERDKLLLARDPFGIKPLYFLETPDCYAFASEPQTFIKAGLFGARENKMARNELLNRAYITGDHTLLDGVKRIPPGTSLWVSPHGIKWNETLDPLLPLRDQSNPKDFDAMFENSIRVHQRCDVPFGLFLSGGIDSSSILAMMTRLNENPVIAITARFDVVGAADESETAKKTAQFFNAQHHVVTVTADDVFANLPAIIGACDDPTSDYAIIPSWFLAKKAREVGLKVVLSGEGGDEMMAGYGRYRRSLRPWWLGGRDQAADSLFKDFGFSISTPPLPIPSQKHWSKLQRVQSRDIKGWLVSDLLTKLDRMLMAHGLEGRTPFLDQDFSPYAFYLDDHDKIKNGKGKFILRAWLHKHAPDFPHDARKQGFTVPIGAWMMQEQSRIDTILRSEDSVIALAGREVLEAALNKTHKDSGLLRWRLLFYAVWCRVHLYGQNPQNVSLWDFFVTKP